MASLPKRIRAITFDFWGTLFWAREDTDRQALRVEALVERCGIAPQQAADALAHFGRESLRSHANEHRTLGPRIAVEMCAAFLDVTMSESLVDELEVVFADAILRFPPREIDGARAAVAAAAARLPVGLISDCSMSPARNLRTLLDRSDMLAPMQAVIFSEETGVSKPEALMFERAAFGLEVAPDEILHIGDLEPTDIDGALGVGASAALFAGANARFADTTKAPHVFRHWSEFVKALDGLLAD